MGGIDAWPAVATITCIIASCLALARFSRRKWPETELFVGWMLLAAVIWAASPLQAAVALL
jgi:hypothetical protein